MGRSVNLIDEQSSTFLRGQGSWTVTNGVVSIDRNNVVADGYASLKVVPTNPNEPIVFSYPSVFVDKVYVDDFVQFHCRVKTIIGSITRVKLANNNALPVFTPLDVTRDSNLVTVEIGSHSFVVGDFVTLYNTYSDELNFNGTFQVTDTTATAVSWEQVGPDESATIRGSLTEFRDQPDLNRSEEDTATGFNRWGICRSTKLAIPDIGQSIFVDIEIEVYQHNGNDVFFTIPFMCISGNVLRDLYVRETLMNMPSFIVEADLNHEFDHGMPDLPLTRFIELVGNFAGDVVSDYYAFEYITLPDGKNYNNPLTLSEFVEPLVAREKFIPWLSQFVGVYLDNPATGKTPWRNLLTEWQPIQQEIDPTANPVYTPTAISRASNVVTATIGSHSINAGEWIVLSGSYTPGTSFNGVFEVTSTAATSVSWSQTAADDSVSTIFGTLTLLDTSWQELEDFNPSFDGLLDYLRWQVKYAYNGLNAGTYAAVVNAAKRVLTGDKTVTVSYFHEGNPWQIMVRTKTSESPDGETENDDPADGVQSFTVVNSLKKVKPAGYKILHECTATGA